MEYGFGAFLEYTMISRVIYIVAPKESLLSLDFPDAGLRACVASQMVWRNDEGGISELTDAGRVEIAKYLVLSYFLQFEEFDEMIGFPDISPNSFDEFWTIQRVPIDGSFENLKSIAARTKFSRVKLPRDDAFRKIISNYFSSDTE